MAGAAQPRGGGQSGVRSGCPPAGGQAAHRDRRGDLRLQRRRLAVHRRIARRGHGGAGDADRPADQPVDAGRRDRRGAGHLRRRQLRRLADRAARRHPDVFPGRRVRRVDRRPRRGAATNARRAAAGPQCRHGVGAHAWVCGGGASAPGCCSDWHAAQSGRASTSWCFSA
ncbi:O-mannosyltransferase domain protein [Mycobacterium intracellulare 1956]|uniref:O-mannosyltransferase domain protein n=1 Tax=Mycobacterium intracellulare 1956 TaxID=1299331 RepID=X8CQH3_MYCIT|nr:O-mannosyltransferase domain protein [Mycobacterium intracellulare 1956]